MKRIFLSLGALSALWLLAPLLWLLCSFPALSRQQPDAGQLVRAAPRTIFGPAEVRHTGQRWRYLSGGWWNGRDIFSTLAADGWQKVDQFGAVRLYQRRTERISVDCRRFSAFFDVCDLQKLVPRQEISPLR